jgi:hypothetical protein
MINEEIEVIHTKKGRPAYRRCEGCGATKLVSDFYFNMRGDAALLCKECFLKKLRIEDRFLIFNNIQMF